jgi:hypothetical protein
MVQVVVWGKRVGEREHEEIKGLELGQMCQRRKIQEVK